MVVLEEMLKLIGLISQKVKISLARSEYQNVVLSEKKGGGRGGVVAGRPGVLLKTLSFRFICNGVYSQIHLSPLLWCQVSPHHYLENLPQTHTVSDHIAQVHWLNCLSGVRCRSPFRMRNMEGKKGV